MSPAKTVLLVDDDADFVEMNRVLLEEHGYAVRVAFSGRQCLEDVAACRPDLIILDMVMENASDGFNVSRELRNSEYTKTIPLVMITSVNDSSRSASSRTARGCRWMPCWKSRWTPSFSSPSWTCPGSRELMPGDDLSCR